MAELKLKTWKITGLQISNLTSANRCYFKNVTELFTSMEYWAKGFFVGFWKGGLFAELQARMSRGCRFLLFLKHKCLVTLNIQIKIRNLLSCNGEIYNPVPFESCMYIPSLFQSMRPNGDQYWWNCNLNTSQYWLILLNAIQCRSIFLGRNAHWSELISNGINYTIFIGIDRHWALIEGVLYICNQPNSTAGSLFKSSVLPLVQHGIF